MHRCCSVFLAFAVMIGVAFAQTIACTPPEDHSLDFDVHGQAQAPSPTIARVGDMELKLSEVDDLAAMASLVRQGLPWELPPPPMNTFEQRLDLAIELLALASAAKDGAIDEDLVSDSMKRSLASVYLRRSFLSESQRPVTEKDLEQAHKEEIKKYVTSGESELYSPTKVDFTIIGVGLNPSWSKYEPGTVKDLMTMKQAMDLARKIKEEAGEQVLDLDSFETLARKFEKHHPTVRIQYQKRAAIPRELFPLAPIIRKNLLALKNNGDISPVIRTPGGAMIIRRGVTWPGKGEDMHEIKNELAGKVRERRNLRHLKEITKELRKKYAIETFPDALTTSRHSERHL